jgi:outer membrane protein TolC
MIMQKMINKKEGRIQYVLILILPMLMNFSGCAREIVGNDRLGPPWNDRAQAIEDEVFQETLTTYPLPAKDKVLTFEDCIITAAQHAPDMVDGLIELELRQIDSESAYSKRFPTINAYYRATINTTQQHKEYSDMSIRLGFGVREFVPIHSYFTHKVSLLMEEVALLMHKITLQKKAYEIGRILLKLKYKEHQIALQRKRLEQANYFIQYQKAKSKESLDPVELAKAEHYAKSVEAELDSKEASFDSLLLKLKLLIGLEVDQQLNVNSSELAKILNGKRVISKLQIITWESAWESSYEAKIFKLVMELHDYDILVSRAGYLPEMSWDVYTANPTSKYATYSSRDDVFLLINFTIPLLDWGDRERNVQRSHLDKQIRSQQERQARREFQSGWQKIINGYRLNTAAYEASLNAARAAALDVKKAEMQYKFGQIDMSQLETLKRDLHSAEMETIDHEFNIKINEYEMWLLQGNFRKRYLSN